MTRTQAQPGEEQQDRVIRPQRLADYVGQAPVKRQLEIFITAARQRAEAQGKGK